MTRFGQLEETFDLPKLEDIVIDEQDSDHSLQESLDHAQALTAVYQQTDHSELHDQEMDEIAKLAVEYGKSLHDLGMSVEVKHAGEIFSASSNMLKIAVDARNNKMEKRLKLMKLELDRIKIDRTTPDPVASGVVEEGNMRVLDRNELLAQLKEIAESDK